MQGKHSFQKSLWNPHYVKNCCRALEIRNRQKSLFPKSLCSQEEKRDSKQYLKIVLHIIKSAQEKRKQAGTWARNCQGGKVATEALTETAFEGKPEGSEGSAIGTCEVERSRRKKQQVQRAWGRNISNAGKENGGSQRGPQSERKMVVNKAQVVIFNTGPMWREGRKCIPTVWYYSPIK